MISIELNSADAIRRNWDRIVSENLIPALMQEGTLSVAAEATINGEVNWRIYNGKIAIRANYRAFDETIAPVVDWITIRLTPQLTQKVALLVLSELPEVQAELAQLNGGQPFEILDPVVPEPEPVSEPVEPAPTEPAPTETEPVTDPSPDEDPA